MQQERKDKIVREVSARIRGETEIEPGTLSQYRQELIKEVEKDKGWILKSLPQDLVLDFGIGPTLDSIIETSVLIGAIPVEWKDCNHPALLVSIGRIRLIAFNLF